MTNRKKSVLEIIAKEGNTEKSKEGYVKRGVILHELGELNIPTHPKRLDVILTALERRGKIESHPLNRVRVPRRRRFRLLKSRGAIVLAYDSQKAKKEAVS